MKWRLFQTKMVDSFLVADLFAIGTQTFGQGTFVGLTPEALVTIRDGQLKWMFGNDYWHKMEKRARSVLGQLDPKMIERCRKAMNSDFAKLKTALAPDAELGKKVEAIVCSAQNIIGTFLGPFESVLPGLISEEIDEKLSSREAEKIVSKLTQPEQLTFRGRYQRDILLAVKNACKDNRISKEEAIVALYSQYSILPIDISGKPWSEEHFENEIEKINSELTPEQIDGELEMLAEGISGVTRAKEELFKKLKASDRLKYLSNITGEMALMRDWRKDRVYHVAVALSGGTNLRKNRNST